MKILFFGIIWDDLFISEVKVKLCLIFQNFQNGRHFELATNFFTGSFTGSWIYQKDSHEHIRHFEFLIDAVAKILKEICQFQNLTYFVILWRHQWRHECAKHKLHNYTSPTMYLQNIVCVAPVLHSQIVRTNIVTNIDTHTNKQKMKRQS